MVKRAAQLSYSAAERFVSLVTFDRHEEPRGLTLFHCPVVPITASLLLAVPPGFIFGNPTTCISRLAVYRGPGVNAYSKEIEAYLLNQLQKHFQADRVTVKTNIPYSGKGDNGDIDLVIYETVGNRLLIGQVKAFIMPDTVEEVRRANQALEKRLTASRARATVAGSAFCALLGSSPASSSAFDTTQRGVCRHWERLCGK